MGRKGLMLKYSSKALIVCPILGPSRAKRAPPPAAGKGPITRHKCTLYSSAFLHARFVHSERIQSANARSEFALIRRRALRARRAFVKASKIQTFKAREQVEDAISDPTYGALPNSAQ